MDLAEIKSRFTRNDSKYVSTGVSRMISSVGYAGEGQDLFFTNSPVIISRNIKYPVRFGLHVTNKGSFLHLEVCVKSI